MIVKTDDMDVTATMIGPVAVVTRILWSQAKPGGFFSLEEESLLP